MEEGLEEGGSSNAGRVRYAGRDIQYVIED